MSAFILALLRGERRRSTAPAKSAATSSTSTRQRLPPAVFGDPRTIGETFNLGYGVTYSVNEIFAHIAKLLDSSLQAGVSARSAR